MDTLWEAQQQLEEEAAVKGVQRFRRTLEKARQAGREDQTQVGSAMVRRIKEHMVPLFLADLEKREAGTASKGGVSLKALRDLDPEAVCEAATRAALARMHRPIKLTTISRRIGEAVEDQVVWARWRNLNRRQADAVQKRVNQSPSAHQRRASLRGFARHWEERAIKDAWSAYRLIGVGLRFVDYLVKLEVFELTKIGTRRPGRRSSASHAVQLTPTAAERARELADYLAVARPLNWPLVAPPIPWTTPSGGGFHFRETLDSPLIPQSLKPLPLVRRACKEQKALLAKADLSVVYAGINAAQATAWRINPKVYSVLTALIQDGRGPGLTPFDPHEEPGRLSDEDARDVEKLRAHKGVLRVAKAHNVKMRSKRLNQHRVFTAAQKFVIEPRIYFAYNMDFRGRVYACSDDLSPQGNDIQRGLLEFAEGDVLTDDGKKWLKVHLANCYGVDKVSFEERVRWAEEHAGSIFATASDPLDTTWWQKADQPWQFLAACFAYTECVGSPAGSLTPCRVPVMLDGSCSGIQHYAALLRDEVAGKEVNLVPGDRPGDLYATVAARVLEKLSESREPFSLEWHSWGIDRKLVKRSVMVLPYGGTFLSNLEYVRSMVRERMDKEGRPKWLTDDNEQEAYVALAKTVWRAMREIVRGPITGMAWVKSVVRSWADQRGHRKLHWTAPCGLPVVTDYRRTVNARQVDGTIGGEALTLKRFEQTDVTNWTRVETAAAPNFVHSLDASHLLISLKRAKEEGISNLAVVHDAFGTTPTRTAEFSRILREEFAKLYYRSPFECLGQAAHAVGVAYPDYPTWGSLSMEGISQSQYLFA
jgi:DNA-directed RNA polymerase